MPSGAKTNPVQKPSGKAIRKDNAPLDVEDFERRVISAALPHGVREESPVFRDSNNRDGG